jgi:glycosyltransferase involved in cell wall biosynthesis
MPLELRNADAARSPTPIVAKALPRVLNVVALNPGRKFGSLEEQLVLLAEAFRREGGMFLPLFIADPSAASFDDFSGRGVRVECLDMRRLRLSALLALRRLIRVERIDLVHWHFTEPLKNGYLWGLSVLCPGLRHWYTDHNSRILPIMPPARGVKQALKALLLKRYRMVLCVSQYVRRCLEEQGGWRHLTAQTHFINTARFAPNPSERDEVRCRQGVGERFVVLVVGQLIPEKGIDVAIRAMASLPPRALLWIVGSGPQAHALASRIAVLGLSDRVHMLGIQANVEPYLQAADVLVCPSTWAEAAGLVNLEAQSCGLPVVASRIGGIPEYVVEGRTGLLFEPGDAAALARQINRLVDDPELRRGMSVQARNWALEQFAPEVRLPELLDLYRTGE